MTPDEFILLASRKFPAISIEVETESGRPHMQMARIASYIQCQIDGRSTGEFKRCTDLIESGLRDGDSDLQNVIGVACLEHLIFKDGKQQRSWAIALVGPLMRRDLAALGVL